MTGYVKAQDGKSVPSRLGESTVRQIAEITGGEYFHADPKRFGVEEVEAALSGLKRTENEARGVQQYDEGFPLLPLPAFRLLGGQASSTRRPRGRGAGQARGKGTSGTAPVIRP